jgi:hypothetical protein
MDSLERKTADKTFWGPKDVWANTTRAREVNEKRIHDKDLWLRSALSGTNSLANSISPQSNSKVNLEESKMISP